jgi:DNA-directed RNA polymerase subunit RPC12/RpoP
MTESIFPGNKEKENFPVVRVSKELKDELDEMKDKLFPVRITYNKVLMLLPRCPSCGSLLVRLDREDNVVRCWKCGKRYRLEEVKE